MTLSGVHPILNFMTTTARSEKLDLRLSPQAKERLFAAAKAQQRSVSEFVLQSALERAEETLADRRLFQLSSEDWARFQAALDAPPRSLPRLKKLLRAPGLFDPKA
ncbi:DUF1778 domain-containing protein [Aestuariivirga sp.]|uniref:type II toxin-antitoxin system TacA family antitoxin n=1 Tax=Aestuariivirga sp. TaxID=2650926 RepID=UPI00359441E4